MKTKLLSLVFFAALTQSCSSQFGTVAGQTEKMTVRVSEVNSALVGSQLCDLSQYSNTPNDASAALQACLDQANGGATIVIQQGKYIIAQRVVISKPVTLTTLYSMSTVPCSASEYHQCAELKADPNILVQNGFIAINSDSVHFDHIVVNGNKDARSNSQAANECRNSQNSYG